MNSKVTNYSDNLLTYKNILLTESGSVDESKNKYFKIIERFVSRESKEANPKNRSGYLLTEGFNN